MATADVMGRRTACVHPWLTDDDVVTGAEGRGRAEGHGRRALERETDNSFLSLSLALSLPPMARTSKVKGVRTNRHLCPNGQNQLG